MREQNISFCIGHYVVRPRLETGASKSQGGVFTTMQAGVFYYYSGLSVTLIAIYLAAHLPPTHAMLTLNDKVRGTQNAYAR